ncbi:MAG: T9SS type A sorting domain-containing protein [Bacteroidota bacterium]
MKSFNNLALDSISVGGVAPASVTITIPYSSLTNGNKDTIHFMARRPGCATALSANKIYVWSSDLMKPLISVLPGTADCSRKILQIGAMQAGVAYQWYEDANFLVGNTLDKDTAYYAGAYRVVATDGLRCESSSNVLNINYNAQKPAIEMTNLSIVETKLTASKNADVYHWYVETKSGIKLIEADTAKSMSVYFDGKYYLGTVNNSCFFMSDAFEVSNKLGGNILNQGFTETDTTIIIPKVDFSVDAKIYPNPVSNDDVKIDYIGGNVTKVTFILYNSQGLVMGIKEVEGDGILRTTINTKYLPSGIYNLYIDDGVKQVRRNLMVY